MVEHQKACLVKDINSNPSWVLGVTGSSPVISIRNRNSNYDIVDFQSIEPKLSRLIAIGTYSDETRRLKIFPMCLELKDNDK